MLAQGGELVVALQDGRVLFVEPANGKVARDFQAGTQVSIGPLPTPIGLFVGANDGTLIQLPRQEGTAGFQ
jgi:hypothetical protein